ncbi:MAG: hypothetical protein M5R42_01545 [Rhodocyclaceae bacterium]|nr:hypothetical protein [Rhodocyclaceae bacterium]
MRGPWIVSGYFKGEGGNVLREAAGSPLATSPRWTPTATCRSPTRSKDVHQVGVAWISSIDPGEHRRRPPGGGGSRGDRRGAPEVGTSGRCSSW